MSANFSQFLWLLNAAASRGTNPSPANPSIRRSIPRALACLCAAALLLSVTAFAQVETGQIAGTITDTSGAVVPQATITVRNLASNATRTAQSSSLGTYLILGLEPGTYQLTVTSTAFKTFTANTEVTVGSHVTVDARLSVGASVTEVQVVAEGGTAVNTQTQELSQVVDSQQLAQLPSLTRNPYDFVVLSGNVSSGDNTTTNMNSSQNLTSRGVGYAVNGQRQTGTGILLDGVENISVFSQVVGQNIPIDSVQEYNVVTNNFAAEYGRASGGIVNLTTKSGANNFHGSAWEFNRLSAYTANTFDNVVAGIPKGVYTRNQFGYAIGGPVKKNKLFFFQSTEWTRVRSQETLSELIPTSQFLSYTAPAVQQYFSMYGSTPYAISSTLNQSDLGIALTGVPAATPILGQVNFPANADAGGDDPQNTYRLLGRLDYSLSENTQMFFRIGKEQQDLFSGTSFASPFPQYDVGGAANNLSTLYSISHTFTPSLFSATKVSFNRLITESSYDSSVQEVPMLMFGAATANGLQITFPGLENFMVPGAGGLPYGGPQNSVQLMEDLSWMKGKHAMRFGFQGTYIQMNIAYGAYAQAVQYLQTGLQPGLQNMVDGTLQYFEAAIDPQGQLPGGSITPPVTPPSFARSFRYRDWALYAQDSFRITPRLTVNYGVRYEHYGVQHNNNQNLDSNFYYGPGSTLFEQISTGQVHIAPQSPIGRMWNPRWGTVGPRVGFAYDLHGDGKTSVRGGYGISYERNFGNVTFNVIQNPPAYGTLQTFNTPVTPSNIGPLGSPGPPVPMPPVELRNVNQNINVASTQFWSFALQRAITRDSMAELSYSGARGIHLYDITAGNPIGGAQAYLGAPPDIGSACDEGTISPSGACLTRGDNVICQAVNFFVIKFRNFRVNFLDN